MAVTKKNKPGEFVWTDLGTTRVDAAKKFYQELFGWTVRDFPMGEGANYSMFRIRGKDVTALYPMMSAQKKMKAPPYWMPYIAVKSVDESVQKATSAGGKIISPPMDVMDQGRQAIMQDPTGATFAMWQARKHKGAQLDGPTGTVGWHDLNTAKPAAAAKFYPKVFGWKVEVQDYGGNKYNLLKLGKEGIGGIWPFPFPKNKLGPGWITYFRVASCAKAVAKVKRLGGSVLMGTTLVPEMVRFAVVADPQRAAFGLLEPLL